MRRREREGDHSAKRVWERARGYLLVGQSGVLSGGGEADETRVYRARFTTEDPGLRRACAVDDQITQTFNSVVAIWLQASVLTGTLTAGRGQVQCCSSLLGNASV